MTTMEATNTELVISLEGKILDSNFEEFCAKLKACIQGLDTELVTDADFDQADADAKQLKAAEKSLKDAKASALEQAEEVQKLFAAIDDVSEEARKARLSLEKQIKARKAARREEIIAAAVDSLDVTLKSQCRPRIEGSLKGRKAFERMEWAAENEAKQIQAEVDAARDVIEAHRKAHGGTLLPDVEKLELQKAELVAVELQRRMEKQKIEEEAKRLREERAAAEREAEAERKAADARAKQMAAKETQAESSGQRVSAMPDVAQATPATRNVADLSEAEEMAEFVATLKQAFAPAKAARAKLKHPANVRKAKTFADDLAGAWGELKKGGAS